MKTINKAKLIGVQILTALCYFVLSIAVIILTIGFVGMVIDGICTVALVFKVNNLGFLVAIGVLSLIISLIIFFKDRKDIFPS